MPSTEVFHLVQSIQQQQHPTGLQGSLQHLAEGQPDPPLFVIAGDEAIQWGITLRQGVGIGGQGQQHRQSLGKPHDLTLSGGQGEGQELEKGGLAGAGIAQDDQTVVVLHQPQQGLGFAQTLPHGLALFPARLATGYAQFTGPGIPFRGFAARLERHIHLQQGEFERNPIGDAHTAKIQVLIAIHQVLQVAGRDPVQIRRGFDLANLCP